MSSVQCNIDFSKNINNTNLGNHQEQMNYRALVITAISSDQK